MYVDLEIKYFTQNTFVNQHSRSDFLLREESIAERSIEGGSEGGREKETICQDVMMIVNLRKIPSTKQRSPFTLCRSDLKLAAVFSRNLNTCLPVSSEELPSPTFKQKSSFGKQNKEINLDAKKEIKNEMFIATVKTTLIHSN
jgi:hypothetical protein